MKQKYEMTDMQLETLLEASKPTPVMYLSGGQSMYRTPQENANSAWKKLGEELKFNWETVEPIHGEGVKVFMAEPVRIGDDNA